jgi:hypothetical protein
MKSPLPPTTSAQRFLSLRHAALCLSFLVTVSCRDLRDLYELGAALQQQYPDSRVSVSLTDGLILTVTVADSAFAVAPCESQAAVATRIASLVRENYGGVASLQTLSVAFAASRSRGRATAGPAGSHFRFAPDRLSRGLTPVDSTRAIESCKAWRELQ